MALHDSMSGISERIAAILEARRARLPMVEEHLAKWTRIDGELVGLEAAADELIAHPGTPPALRDIVRELRSHSLRSRVAENIAALRVVKRRFERPTLNIGVSGQARVGKSTLLQAIAGLSEQQVPTGKNLPVTAVRSRIAHSPHRRATLSLHDYVSFRADVLSPYHREIGLPAAPEALELFRRYPYPESKDALPQGPDQDKRGTLLSRLKDMQAALPSYEDLLRGSKVTVDLDGLREYIAYPTAEQEMLPECSRRYLAVRDAFIECPFPLLQVENLMLVDLPGLGEVAAETERHHVDGLQHEVDIVLYIKRPVTGLGYFGDKDARALGLLQEARGAIQRPGDFVVFVVNRDEDQDATAALLLDLRRKINEGEEGRHYQVLSCDARDPQDVYGSVLARVLQKLAERLGGMDAEVLSGAAQRTSATVAELRTVLRDINDAIAQQAPERLDLTEMVYVRAAQMRKLVSSDLHELVSQLFREARGTVEDDAYVGAVEEATNGLRTWIAGGFGKGQKAWLMDALRTMRQDDGSGPFVTRELNRIRVQISTQYCQLDDFLAGKVSSLWQRIATVLQRHTGGLLQGADAAHLAQLQEALTSTSPWLAQTVRDLLQLRIEYRTHLHPRIRRALDSLHPQQRHPLTGKEEMLLVAEVSEHGVTVLSRQIQRLAEQAVYETRKALLEDLALPVLVLHAAAEQFHDAFIRGAESERDFRLLARSFRDEIWPGEFQSLDAHNARVARVLRACRSISDSLVAPGFGSPGPAQKAVS